MPAETQSTRLCATRTVASSDVRFAAAAGWRQATTGMHPAAPQPPSAVVANVPLEDPPASLPYTTLRHLPATGVVIAASIYVPMRAHEEANFPTRSLPLRLADADVRHAWETQPNRDVPEYLLLQRVNGFDVDVRVYFGSQQPTTSSVAEAQAELDRLMLPSRERA